MKRLHNFMLIDEETYGIGTQEQINQIVIEKGFPVWFQTLASKDAVENFICEGGTVAEGTYIIENGVIEVCGESEDYEIVHISNLRLAI